MGWARGEAWRWGAVAGMAGTLGAKMKCAKWKGKPS
jgi:hypothetical protein